MIKLAQQLHPIVIGLLQNSNQVKTAGILSKLQEFLKKLFSSEKEEVKVLLEDIEFIQNYLVKLNNKLKEIKSTLTEGDINLYHQILREIRELTLQLYQKLREFQQEGKEVEKIIRHYTAKEMQDIGFEKKIQQHMPEEFDLEFNRVYHKPIKNFLWFKNITPESIFIRGGEGTAESQLIQRIKDILIKNNLLDDEDKNFKNSVFLVSLLNNFKQAVVDGELISVQPKMPSKKVSNIPVGQIVVHILTAPFHVPEKDIYLQAKIGLIDSRTSSFSQRKLSLQYTTNLNIVSKTASQLHQFYKKAQTKSIKYTKLNDLQLAQTLRQGYKQVFGQNPSLELLAGAWSQAALESGRPVILPENNIGNIKATSSWISEGKPYFTKKTIEFSPKGEKKGEPNATWKAFSTPIEGAAEYWKLLKNNFKLGFDWMAAGDPSSATIAMSINPVKKGDKYFSKSYYTAHIPTYVKGVNSLYKEFFNKIAPQLPNLKSNIQFPPGNKPEMKDWASDYTQEELKQLNTSTPKINLQDSSEKLLKELLATEKFPLTNLIVKSISPIHNNIVISFLNSNNSLNHRFAKIASHVFKNFWNSDSVIVKNRNNIFLNLEIKDRPWNAVKIAEIICQAVSINFQQKKIGLIQPIISLGFKIDETN